MKIKRAALVVCLAMLCSPFVHAAESEATNIYDANAIKTDDVTNTRELPDATSSSSLPDAPSASLAAGMLYRGSVRGLGPNTGLRLKTDPFSALALEFSVGLGGFGMDVATPLATKLNLHGSFSFLNVNPNVTEQGFPIAGSIRLRSVGLGVDIFPYRSGFHITPGVTIYNGNQARATTVIPGGQTFTINDTDYMSAPADPVHGTFNVNFGHKIAPSLTMGFGNMLRRDSHWSVPVDFGVEYIGTPRFTLNMLGSVCDSDGDCAPVVQDPDTQSNLQQQQKSINDDIAPLRFFPILKIGLSYRFGRIHEMSNWR